MMPDKKAAEPITREEMGEWVQIWYEYYLLVGKNSGSITAEMMRREIDVLEALRSLLLEPDSMKEIIEDADKSQMVIQESYHLGLKHGMESIGRRDNDVTTEQMVEMMHSAGRAFRIGMLTDSQLRIWNAILARIREPDRREAPRGELWVSRESVQELMRAICPDVVTQERLLNWLTDAGVRMGVAQDARGEGATIRSEMDRFLSACSGSPEDRERYVSGVLQKQRPGVGRKEWKEVSGYINRGEWTGVDLLVWLAEKGVEVKDA